MSTEITNGIEKIYMAERLTPSQKAVYEEAKDAFKLSKRAHIVGEPVTDILTKDSMLHSGSAEDFAKIIDGLAGSDIPEMTSSD